MSKEELLKYYEYLHDCKPVYAIVLLGVNDYVVMPTYISSIKVNSKDGLLPEAMYPKCKCEDTYNVTRVYWTEIEAVQALKDTRERAGLGEYSNYLLGLYKDRFPELWI